MRNLSFPGGDRADEGNDQDRGQSDEKDILPRSGPSCSPGRRVSAGSREQCARLTSLRRSMRDSQRSREDGWRCSLPSGDRTNTYAASPGEDPVRPRLRELAALSAAWILPVALFC
jgi:hypothetical protein